MSDNHVVLKKCSCFLCDCIMANDKESLKIFDLFWVTSENSSKISLSDILISILGCKIYEASVHSAYLCTECKNLMLKYKSTEKQLHELRSNIVTTYNRTVQIHNNIHSKLIQSQETDENFNAVENIEIDYVSDNGDEITLTHMINDLTDEATLIEGNMNIINSKEILDPLSEASNQSDVNKKMCERNIKEEQEVTLYNICDFSIKCEETLSLESCKNINLASLKQEKLKCKVCGKKLSSKTSLKGHIVLHHSPDKNNKKFRSIQYSDEFQCKICDKVLASKRCFKSHMRVIHNQCFEHYFQCQICSKKFHSTRYYEIHMQNHKKRDRLNSVLTENTGIFKEAKGYKCEECDKEFSYPHEIKEHMEKHKDIGERERHACRLCDKTYFSKTSLQRHERGGHGITSRIVENCDEGTEYIDNFLKNVYKCQECDKLFATEITLKHHMEIHKRINENQTNPVTNFDDNKVETNLSDTLSSEVMHKCIKCGKILATMESLRYHMEIHSEMLFECKICKVNFMHKRGLKKHKMFHIKERQPTYECDICHKKFVTISNFKTHKLIHTSTQTFKCEDCGKEYAQLRNLKEHQKKKKYGKRFKCKFCDKSYYAKVPMKEHEGTHVDANEYEFKCEICEEKFYTKTELKKHTTTHTNELQCDICEKKFLHKFLLEQHKTIVHMGIKKFLCDICGKSFPLSGTLKTHYSVHSSEYPLECLICKKRFKDKCRLSTHTNKMHNKKEKCKN